MPRPKGSKNKKKIKQESEKNASNNNSNKINNVVNTDVVNNNERKQVVKKKTDLSKVINHETKNIKVVADDFNKVNSPGVKNEPNKDTKNVLKESGKNKKIRQRRISGHSGTQPHKYRSIWGLNEFPTLT